MHTVIQQKAPQIPDYVESARQLGEGLLEVRDIRHIQHDPTAQDTIGRFHVRAGRILPDSYEPNPQHRILSNYGMLSPHPELQKAIVEAMRTQAGVAGMKK